MEIKKRNMIQQDLKVVRSYILGVISLVLALFIPFALLMIVTFKASGLLILAFILPLAALIIGIIAFVKSLKQPTSSLKPARILSAIAIILSFICLAFLLYIFIKGGVFSSI